MNIALTNKLPLPQSSVYMGFEQKSIEVQALFHPKKNLEGEISAALESIQKRFYDWVIRPLEDISIGYNSKWFGRFAIKEIEVKRETLPAAKASVLQKPVGNITPIEENDPKHVQVEPSKAEQLKTNYVALRKASNGLFKDEIDQEQVDPEKLKSYLSQCDKTLNFVQKLYPDPQKIQKEQVPSLTHTIIKQLIISTLNQLYESGKLPDNILLLMCKSNIPEDIVFRLVVKKANSHELGKEIVKIINKNEGGACVTNYVDTGLVKLAANKGYRKVLEILIPQAYIQSRTLTQGKLLEDMWLHTEKNELTLAEILSKMGSVELFKVFERALSSEKFNQGILRNRVSRNAYISSLYIAAINGRIQLLEYFHQLYKEELFTFFEKSFQPFWLSFPPGTHTLFHDFINRGHLEVLQFFHRILNRDTFLNLLKAENCSGFRPMSAVFFRNDIKVLEWIAKTFNLSVLIDLLDASELHKQKISSKIIQKFACIEKIIGKDDYLELVQKTKIFKLILKEGSAVKEAKLKFFHHMLKVLGNEALKEIILERSEFNTTLLHNHVNLYHHKSETNDPYLINLLDLILSLLTNDEKFKLISSSERHGTRTKIGTVLHRAANSLFLDFFTLVAKHVTKEQLVKLFYTKDFDGFTPLDYLVNCYRSTNYFHRLDELLPLLPVVLKIGELKNFLGIKNKEGCTLFSLIFCNGNTKDLEFLLQNLTLADLKELLLQQTDSGETALHLAVEGYRQASLKLLLNHFDSATLEELVDSQTQSGESLAHYAAIGACWAVFNLLKQHLQLTNLKKVILTKTRNSETIFHFLFKWEYFHPWNMKKVQWFIEAIQQLLSPLEFEELFLAENSEGHTILFNLVELENSPILEYLIENHPDVFYRLCTKSEGALELKVKSLIQFIQNFPERHKSLFPQKLENAQKFLNVLKQIQFKITEKKLAHMYH